MKMLKITAVACLALVLALPCLATKATPVGTVDVVLDNFGAHDITTVWGGGLDGVEVYGGVYLLNKSASTGVGDTWPNGLTPVFCIELHELAPHSTCTYNVVTPDAAHNNFLGGTLGQTKADYLADLWERFYDPAWSIGTPYTDDQNSDAEAFGAAVWEIVYEDLPSSPAGWDVTTDGTAGVGGFYATGLDTNKANSYLHSLTGSGPKAGLYAFTNCGTQDFITVPEPATIAMLGIGGILSLIRRKRTAV